MTDALLEVSGLSVAYGAHLAASDVDLTVAVGQTTGLLGPNGAGKSTVIHTIVGLVSPQAGEVLVCGAPADSAAAKSEIGFAPDDLPTPLSLTGRETIGLMARLRGPAFDLDLAHWLSEQLDLGEALDRPVRGYSHGMRRKLQLACAVSHRPAVLVLDEPMRGLDPEAGAILQALMDVHLQQGGGILLATHDLHTAETLCDTVTIMAAGRVVGQGPPREVAGSVGHDSLESAFLVLSGLADRIADRRSQILTRMTPPSTKEHAS